MADDTDVFVAEARALALRLNAMLDKLATCGVKTVSVIGAPPDYRREQGMFHPFDRVSLCLDFVPQGTPENGETV